MNSLKLSKRVIGIALSVLFVNAALADANSDARIQAYKANKLIPQNVVLSTSTGAADSDEVVVFNKSALSWKSDNAANAKIAMLQSKYEGWTKQDFDAAFAGDEWITNATPEVEEMRQYLSVVIGGEISSDNLSSNLALEALQSQWDQLAIASSSYVYGVDFGAFPAEHISLGSQYIGLENSTDLSRVTGLTVARVMAANCFDPWNVTMPPLDFSGITPADLPTSGAYNYGMLGTSYNADPKLAAYLHATNYYTPYDTMPQTTDGTYDYTDLDVVPSLGMHTNPNNKYRKEHLMNDNLPAVIPNMDITGVVQTHSGSVDYSLCTGFSASTLQIGDGYYTGIKLTSEQYNIFKQAVRNGTTWVNLYEYPEMYMFVDGVKKPLWNEFPDQQPY